MTDQPVDCSKVLSEIDEILEAAYFVPLDVGDALAVQFKVDSLKGLSVETAAGVFALIDSLEAEPDEEGRPDLAGAADLFFSRLAKEFPDVYGRWAADSGRLRLDPEGAFQIARSKSEGRISAWLTEFFSTVPTAKVEKTRAEAAERIMSEFDVKAVADDRALRIWLREKVLSSLPVWAGPGVYLDCWSDFVRAVLDWSPSPALKARWPF